MKHNNMHQTMISIVGTHYTYCVYYVTWFCYTIIIIYNTVDILNASV